MEEEEVNEEGRRKRGEDEEGGELDMNTGGPGVYFSVVCLWTQAASPVLQLVHAGVGRPADAGDLLPLLPLRQLLGDQVRQQRLSDVQEVGQLGHHVLTNRADTSTRGAAPSDRRRSNHHVCSPAVWLSAQSPSSRPSSSPSPAPSASCRSSRSLQRRK